MGFFLPRVAQPKPMRKRVIYYGWGVRDTMFVRKHWREMERMPFDGTGIVVAIDRKAWLEGDTSTGNRLNWHIFGPKAFKLGDFREAIFSFLPPFALRDRTSVSIGSTRRGGGLCLTIGKSWSP